MRDTIANLAQRLAAGPFVRTQQSYIVSVEKFPKHGQSVVNPA